jgi:hypothetical protein
VTAADWVPGDTWGLPIPAHSAALRAGGEAFLTQAFRVAGVLAADNSVTRITQLEECPGGSTGRKLLLSVEYERPARDLHTDLFVKFSRDFDDEIRDRGRIQMELETRFAALSRVPDFPITVPKCFFADFQHDSGTGILITQRVLFGTGAIERHYAKCLDYQMPEPLAHYRAVIKSLARLAGTFKAGRLPAGVVRQFPFDPSKLTVSERAPYTARQLQNRVARFADFAAKFPRLLPQNITAPPFIARLSQDVARFPQHQDAIRAFLRSQPKLIALCHWNANVDNAWFWRDPSGELQCGLLDWGHVSQMNVAMSLWGSLSAAEWSLWDEHLEPLLELFVREFRDCGGPALAVEELTLHLELYVAIMGLAWLLDSPPLIQSQIPDLAELESRFDQRLQTNEFARAQLQMMTTFLSLWERRDFGSLPDRLQGGSP